MLGEGRTKTQIVIDPDMVSTCIMEPASHAMHIEALMNLCSCNDIEIVGCTEWMAYLSQLMVSTRYYYLLKDYRFTRRLATRDTPALTLYFIEQLYNATTVKDMQSVPVGTTLHLRQRALATELACIFAVMNTENTDDGMSQDVATIATSS